MLSPWAKNGSVFCNYPGTKLRHPFLSPDYNSRLASLADFIFLFPSMRSLVPGYFAIIFMAEFETDLIRQSNNKIVINGDVVLGDGRINGYLLTGQANTFQPRTKFTAKMKMK